MSRRGFSLNVFVPSGEPYGVRVVTKSNWIGVAVSFPTHQLVEAVKRGELKGPGVYVLWDGNESPPDTPVYVGESDQLGKRLAEHRSRKTNTGKLWDECTDVVVFASRAETLNKASVRYIEAKLYELGKAGGRCSLRNKNEPKVAPLAESDAAAAEAFLADMLLCLPLLGLTAFQVLGSSDASEDSRSEEVLTATFPQLKITARACRRPEGFVVMKGSQARLQSTEALKKFYPRLHLLRESFVQNGVLARDGDHYRFSKDYAFGGHNPATAVIKGGVGPGVKEVWKDERGRPLAEIMELE